jgi:hypothetical protein
MINEYEPNSILEKIQPENMMLHLAIIAHAQLIVFAVWLLNMSRILF